MVVVALGADGEAGVALDRFRVEHLGVLVCLRRGGGWQRTSTAQRGKRGALPHVPV